MEETTTMIKATLGLFLAIGIMVVGNNILEKLDKANSPEKISLAKLNKQVKELYEKVGSHTIILPPSFPIASTTIYIIPNSVTTSTGSSTKQIKEK